MKTLTNFYWRLMIHYWLWKGVKKAIKARGGIVKDPWKAAGEAMAQMPQTKTLAPKQHRHHFRGRIPLPPESHSQGPYIPPPK